jgi:hypothetical protein
MSPRPFDPPIDPSVHARCFEVVIDDELRFLAHERDDDEDFDDDDDCDDRHRPIRR